ncbi:hypothetical protein HELRODRAFT_178662 [Helobdella robusta]|uniref:Uncharacterized protein n=1 Tax=Helobdella robusta TaxID=6412 RepID=T1FDI8_HELRO|nr:hypothetical protein HELRODRAFT_178662 [Helobdella robusta]ESN96862.1 hypothetical protein HELRODRAFT_178662 [Helobdella robusta]
MIEGSNIFGNILHVVKLHGGKYVLQITKDNKLYVSYLNEPHISVYKHNFFERNHGYITNPPEQYIPAYYDISQNHIISNHLASNLTNTTTSPSTSNNITVIVNILSRFGSSSKNYVFLYRQ